MDPLSKLFYRARLTLVGKPLLLEQMFTFGGGVGEGVSTGGPGCDYGDTEESTKKGVQRHPRSWVLLLVEGPWCWNASPEPVEDENRLRSLEL